MIIVNYRTAELVERCLETVRATRGELQLQTVVVDNASSDGEGARLRAALPEAEVVEMSENRGFAAGVNVGFAHATAELAVLLNPDTEVRAGALQALIQRLLNDPSAAIVAPLIEDADGSLTPNAYRRFPNLLSVAVDMCVPLNYALALVRAPHPAAMSVAALQAGRRPARVCGAAMAVRRGAFEDAGPLDEGFFLYFEEVEWQERIAARGWKIELEPTARVCHLVRGGSEASLAPSPYFVTSAVRYLRMHHVPALLSRATFALALLASSLTLRLIALHPARRQRALVQARIYASLLGRLR